MNTEILFLVHQGTECSFELFLNTSRTLITVVFTNGKRVCYSPGSTQEKVDFIMPSVDGNVLLCLCQSGKAVTLASETGEILSSDSALVRQTRFYT